MIAPLNTGPPATTPPTANRPSEANAPRETARAVEAPDKGSAAARESLRQTESETRRSRERQDAHREPVGRAGGGRDGQPSPEEERRVAELRARDRAVRAHEQAHQAAAGTHARGGADLQFEEGPDGRRYAVAGEVRIDTAPVPGDPRATLQKAEQIRRAANAPAQPSAQDRQVAREAAAMAAEARRELQAERSAQDPAREHHRVGSYRALQGHPPGQVLDLFA